MATKFQTAVNLYPEKGIPGATASLNPMLSAPFNYHAKEAVNIGGFCWDNGDGTVSGKTTTPTAKPVGFVHLDRIYTQACINADATLAIPEGSTVEVMTGGDFYASPAAAVTKGQKVFAATADGTLKGGDAAGSVGGCVETPFYWAEDVAAGEIGVITTNFI